MAVQILTGAHLRAARALLDWGQDEVAEKGNVDVATIKRMEAAKGPVSARISTLVRVAEVFEKAGIRFLPPDPGDPPGMVKIHYSPPQTPKARR